MNRVLLFSLLTLFGTTLQADHYDGDADMEQSVLNDHSSGVIASVVHPGLNDEYGSVLFDIDGINVNKLPPTAAGGMIKNEGIGDEFGSVLLDI
jgi:hypothetical protein